MQLKEYIIHQMSEAKREMIEAVKDLPADAVSSMKPGGHWPIGWIVQHCCQNADFFLYEHMTGKSVLEHDERYRGWPLKEPKPEDIYPSSEKLIERWSAVWDAVIAEFRKLDESSISEKLHGREPLAESCLRVINHANSHLRAIWCLLGEQRVDSKYPEQQTWLA